MIGSRIKLSPLLAVPPNPIGYFSQTTKNGDEGTNWSLPRGVTLPGAVDGLRGSLFNIANVFICASHIKID